MSDPLPTLFDRLREDDPPAPFAPARQVRERGRRRRRRSRLATAAVLLVVAGTAAGGAVRIARSVHDPVVDGGTATPGATASAPATPSPPSPPRRAAAGSAIPATALLTAADFGSGWRAEPVDDLGPGGPDWPWDLRTCPKYRRADYPSLAGRGPARVLAFAKSGQGPAAQTVERYADATANITDTERVAHLCARYRATGGPVYDDTSGMDRVIMIVDTGIAGDESLLLRETMTYLQGKPLAPAGPPRTTYHAVVRGGDVVTTVTVQTDDEQFVRRLAARAAQRLP